MTSLALRARLDVVEVRFFGLLIKLGSIWAAQEGIDGIGAGTKKLVAVLVQNRQEPGTLILAGVGVAPPSASIKVREIG